MKIKFLLIFLIGISINLSGQIAPDKYYIQFTDKNNSPYSIENPEEFLSQRAINRRNRFDISITENDIPVNTTYIQGVASFGVQILNPTKWLNGVTIFTTNSSIIYQIEALPYVSSVRKVNTSKETVSDKLENIKGEVANNYAYQKSITTLDYGLSYAQIEQLNGIKLHENGFQGEGMVIAVLDAGFTGVIEHPVFEYMWDNNRVLGTKDFVYIGGNVYEGHEHGKMVLSCIAAYLPGEMIGTAPEAEFWLLRSEEGPHENIIEEYNWVSAAEFADSVGADVINSSLSYFDFDMPEWTYDVTDMDGNTAISTIGADIAASKGMIICNSAGNSGTYVGAPADGDSVFTVGSVDLNGIRSSFSSIGPTADGRIKPNVMACGQGATVAVGDNGISTANGTSFSSPIMAGMVACLWQSHPEMSAMEVQESIMESGSTAGDPDNLYGWGIPDFAGTDSKHFTPIWIGNPYQPMNMLLSSATLDGIDLSIGDEIGIFDIDGSGNEICVGVGLLDGPIVSGSPFAMTVSADDPSTTEIDGFTTGNTIVYRAFDAIAQTEYSAYQASYNAAFDNNFSPLGTALVDVAFFSYITQTLSLSTGWNIMSYYVAPDNMSLLSILDPLVTSGELTKVINESGGFIQFIPGVGWMNTIGDMANTEGYYIKVNASTSLDATGSLVSLPYNIPLSTGWNIMGYPVDQPEDAITVLDQLITASEVIKVINEAGGFIQYIPGVGWMNTIGNFEGGEGYYIKVNANTSLTIGGAAPAWQCGDPLEDPRDGQTYNTVLIGEQCWMAENLNVGTRINGVDDQTDNSTIEKYCYGDDVANCNTYGGLYQWDEMMQYVTNEGAQGICPTGWHLPIDNEWKTLEMELGMTQAQADAGSWRGTDQGLQMKSTSGWYNNDNGTNSSGFTGLPGGNRFTTGDYSSMGYNGWWWSATEYSSSGWWHRYLSYFRDNVFRYYNFDKKYGFSVRCLKD